MKTRELIAALQVEDPAGECDVSIGGEDAWFVERLPGYYDGCHSVLIRDPKAEYYNIVGVEIRGSDSKIRIVTRGWKDALCDNPDMPVAFDGEYARSHYADKIEAWRAEV